MSAAAAGTRTERLDIANSNEKLTSSSSPSPPSSLDLGRPNAKTHSMAASFGSGACFSLVSGVGGPNPIPNAISTGVVFALFQGAFYQIGKQFSKGKGKEEKAAAEAAFFRTDQMLETLGLIKYKKNFRRGMLSDTTLPLLTDSALHEVSVPPGPRLLILDHVTTYKNYYKQDLAKRTTALLPRDQ